MILSDPGGPPFLGGAPLPSSDRAAYLAKQSSIMTSSIVLRRAVDRLGGGQSVRELRNRLQVRPSADMAGISIVATGPDSASAASLANDVGIAYQDVAAERASRDAAGAIRSIEKIKARRQAELDASPGSPGGQLTARQQLLSNQIVELEQREQDIVERVALYGSGVELFERAERPESPTQPKPRLGALLGALLGLLGAGIWAWWAAARNQRTEGPGDPARILGAPLLGEVPAPRASWGVADAYHVIVASLEHELAGVGGSSVAVTSVGLGDSRTATTLSIAAAASEEHRKVLLIDADERTRRLSELYSFHEVDAQRDLRVMRLPPGPRRSASGRFVSRSQEYVGRLVDTGSAMMLPITQNGTDPGPSGQFVSRSRHWSSTVGRRTAVRHRADRHAGSVGGLGRPEGRRPSRRHRAARPSRGSNPGSARGPGAPRFRQDAADRLRLRPTGRRRPRTLDDRQAESRRAEAVGGQEAGGEPKR